MYYAPYILTVYLRRFQSGIGLRVLTLDVVESVFVGHLMKQLELYIAKLLVLLLQCRTAANANEMLVRCNVTYTFGYLE